MNLTQLIINQKTELDLVHPEGKCCGCYTGDMGELYPDAHMKLKSWYTESIKSIIISELVRKKSMEKQPPEDVFFKSQIEQVNRLGYNTAIHEDIAYLENVLEELEKNV